MKGQYVQSWKQESSDLTMYPVCKSNIKCMSYDENDPVNYKRIIYELCKQPEEVVHLQHNFNDAE